jgi:gliding motility-associated-like protein
VLAATAADRDGNQVQLSWAEPAGQGSGWSYRLLLLDAGNTVVSSRGVSGTANLDATPPANQQVLRYRLEATSAAGLTVFSNVASVVRHVVVTIPTAFTPNGDGLNDVLEIKGRFLKNFNFTVFDRNGMVVFKATERTQTWDGRVRGVQAAPQVFPYQFEATDETGQRVVQRGTVTLLR